MPPMPTKTPDLAARPGAVAPHHVIVAQHAEQSAAPRPAAHDGMDGPKPQSNIDAATDFAGLEHGKELSLLCSA